MKRLALALLFAALSARADTLLILNKSDATLQFVDASSFETIGTVATGEGPHEVAVSDDGKMAVVANYGPESGDYALRHRCERAEATAAVHVAGVAAAAWHRGGGVAVLVYGRGESGGGAV
jgi:hypothetical protein